jgi:hypothetical protein
MKTCWVILIPLIFTLSCEDSEDTPQTGLSFAAGTFPDHQYIAISNKNGMVLQLSPLSSEVSIKNFNEDVTVTLMSKYNSSWSITSYTHVVSDTLQPESTLPSNEILGEHLLKLPDVTNGIDSYSPSFGFACGGSYENPERYKIYMCDESDRLFLTVRRSQEVMPRYLFTEIGVGGETTVYADDVASMLSMSKVPLLVADPGFVQVHLDGKLANGNFVSIFQEGFIPDKVPYFAVPGTEVTSFFAGYRSDVHFILGSDQSVIYRQIATTEAPLESLELLEVNLGNVEASAYPKVAFQSSGVFTGFEAVLSGGSVYWNVFGPGGTETSFVLPQFTDKQAQQLGLTLDKSVTLYSITYFRDTELSNYRDWYTNHIERRSEPAANVLSKTYKL